MSDLRIVFTGAEISALDGLPTRSKALYFTLRVRMDGPTRLVGHARGVSWAALARDLHVEPHRGEVERSPSIRQIRNAAGWLKRANLLEMRSDRNLWKLVFFLPAAPQLSRARNQPVSNRAGQAERDARFDSHRENAQLSTARLRGMGKLTGQTSKSLSKHRAAADDRASLTAPKATRAALRAEVNGKTAYRVPPRDALMPPPLTTEQLWRHYEVIAAQRRLNKEVLQLAFDGVAGVMRHHQVTNPVQLFVTILDQITAGRFYDQKAEDHAKRERGGGSALTAEERDIASMIAEGSPPRAAP